MRMWRRPAANVAEATAWQRVATADVADGTPWHQAATEWRHGTRQRGVGDNVVSSAACAHDRVAKGGAGGGFRAGRVEIEY
jgi:hypothetical protein